MSNNSAELSTDGAVKNVVLVHGAFADGSGWRGVYDNLTSRGHRVTIVQIPLTSLEDDVAATTRVLDQQDGPTILVGHSWGGTVITEAGTHDNVAGLVYVAALAPDAGQTTAQQYEGFAPTPDFVIDVGEDGFGFLNREHFKAGFAADASDSEAAFMRDAQVPINMSVFETAVTKAAWRSKPSWYLVATDDHMIPPPAQRTMAERIGATVSEVAGSHAIYVSQPAAVAGLITQAAQSVDSNRVLEGATAS